MTCDKVLEQIIYLSEGGLKVMAILLPQPTKSCDYRYTLPVLPLSVSINY